MKCTTVQFTSFMKTRLFLLKFMQDAAITSSEKRIHGRYRKEYVELAGTKYSHFITANNSAVCMFRKYVSPKLRIKITRINT